MPTCSCCEHISFDVFHNQVDNDGRIIRFFCSVMPSVSNVRQDGVIMYF